MSRSDQLIRTKFFIPRLTRDHVSRENLLRKLDAVTDYNLTLVSAPAGYGKSTLVASWLKNQSCSSAWISLDESDDNLFLFLRYFIEALRSYDQSFGTELVQLLESPDPPSDEIIISEVLNGLVSLQGPIILVLDDFHFIKENSIITFIEEIVKHPLPGLSLILITRSDPKLPLHKLRLSAKLLEIRPRDLSLRNEETRQLLKERFGINPPDSLIQDLLEVTEGWISGLKVLIRSVQEYQELNTVMENKASSDIFQVEYRLENYLSSLSTDIRQYVLTASIFSEFTADLCEYVISKNGTTEGSIEGNDFIAKLVSEGIIIIPLDARSQWYKYHHLFHDLIGEKLQREVEHQTILILHEKASDWFESNGFLQMAIKHAIKAGDEPRALELFTKHRIELLNNGAWNEHESLLGLFSKDCRDHSPVLLLSRSWINIYHGKMKEAFELLSPSADQLSMDHSRGAFRTNLEGEWNTIHSYYSYYQGEARDIMAKTQLAIDQLDSQNIYPLGFAWIFHGAGYLMLGQTDRVVPMLYKGFENTSHNYVKSSILNILCYIHWLDGNLTNLRLCASQLIELGEKYNSLESMAYGHVFSGYSHYQTDQLTSAREHFQKANKFRYHIIGSVRTQAIIGLIMVSYQLGDKDQAVALLDDLEKYVSASGNEYMIKMAALVKAELEFRQGQVEKAFQLTQKIGIVPLRPYSDFFAPELYMAKIWIYYGIPSCENNASEMLDEIEVRLQKVNNSRFLIDLYALKSIYNFDAGNLEISMKYLEKSVRLARPGGFIRVFADMGEKMKEVILASPMSARDDKYIEQILASFKNIIKHIPAETLSLREEEILQYLSHKLSNKEIGKILYISEKTVKNHLNSIYRKLNVSSRREALIKAREGHLL